MKQLTVDQIEELRMYDTPTICNSIESFHVRDRTLGFTNPQLRLMVGNGSQPIVGYAVTAKISAKHPGKPEHNRILRDYYHSYCSNELPKIAVIQDIDEEPVGSFWGDVQATVHQSLGGVGVITNGGVRDIYEVEKLGFYFFARKLLISHAYVHMECADCEVDICGMSVRPGDLIHADVHGAIVIPEEVAPNLAKACYKAQQAEHALLDPCRMKILEGRKPTADELLEWRQEMIRLRNI